MKISNCSRFSPSSTVPMTVRHGHTLFFFGVSVAHISMACNSRFVVDPTSDRCILYYWTLFTRLLLANPQHAYDAASNKTIADTISSVYAPFHIDTPHGFYRSNCLYALAHMFHPYIIYWTVCRPFDYLRIYRLTHITAPLAVLHYNSVVNLEGLCPLPFDRADLGRPALFRSSSLIYLS